MAIQAKDLIKFSELIVKEDSEINHRAAASRAYYAAYHCANSISDEIDDVPRENTGLHSHLIKKFQSSTVNRIKRVGYMLSQCRDYRVEADYDLNDDFTQKSAYVTLEQAKRIIEILEKE